MVPVLLALLAPALAVSTQAARLAPAPASSPQAAGLALADTIPPPDTVIEAAGIVVRSTRWSRRVQDEAIWVEVIDREEVQEKLLMRPGGIAMLLAETGGIQLQPLQGGLGGSAVRIRGLAGRHTLFLADGLPVYGGQPAGLGPLQIPPMDLEQVEVIKGIASALYGGGALGGVVNLISRRPGDEASLELLANGTSRGGADLLAYAETPLAPGWSASVLVGGHRQGVRDVDGSAWADIPEHDRGTGRLRLFHEGEGGRSALLTLGGMAEDRLGGTVPGAGLPPESPLQEPFVDGIDTRRWDGGLHLRLPVWDRFFELRASAMETDFDRAFGILGDEDAGDGSRGVRFVEASLAGATGPHDWVFGAAFQRDQFRHRIPAHQGTALDFDHSVAGLFGQAQIRVSQKWTAAGSARVDRHNEFGTQVSPRISLLHRGDPWTVRISGGRGYLASTPLTPEVEELGMTGVVIVSDLEPEVARGYAVDAGRTWGPVELQVAGFAYRIRNEAQLVRLSHGNAVRSQREPTRLRGAEGLVRYRAGEVTLTGSHLFVRTPRAATAPPVPRHTAGLVAVWEDHDRGLLGLELYYHGRRPLADGGYRSESRPWIHVGVLGELRMGARSVFVNMENLLGVRQTRWDPLLRPIPDWFGRRTTEIWAPLDGFTLNAGIRMRFGGDHGDDHFHE